MQSVADWLNIGLSWTELVTSSNNKQINQKLICSKSEEATKFEWAIEWATKFCWNQANHSQILNTVSGIKARIHTLIQSRQKKGHLKQMYKTQLREPSTGNERITARDRILMESKPKAQKNIDLLKIKRRFWWI